MTCIVGIEHKDGVLLAADSMSSNHYSADVASVAKLFRVGQHGFGFTSSWRMGDLLRYHLALPDPPAKDLHRHLVTVAIPAIRACLKEGGFATVNNGVETGGSFLIAVRGQLFTIDTDFQVARSSHKYDAVGSGSLAALGALSATIGGDPRARATAALVAAEKHTCHVRRPWRFLSTTTETA